MLRGKKTFVWRLIILGGLFLLLSTATPVFAEATTTYNFVGVTQASCNSNGICAHESDVDQFPYGSSNHRNDFVQPNNGEYNAISANDGSRWSTDDPGNNDEIFVQFDMKINESVDSISQIDFTFVGNTDGSGWFGIPLNTEHRIYVKRYNFGDTQSGAWVQVGDGQNITADTDGQMTRSLTSGFNTYIDPSTGKITWGVYETRSSEDMRVNYVEMVVSSNEAPSKPILNSPADNAYLSTNQPTFSWFAATDVDDPPGDLTYYIKIGSSEIDVGSNLSYTPGSSLAEGAHNWCVRVRDDSFVYSSEWAAANCRDAFIDTGTPGTPAYINEGSPSDIAFYPSNGYNLNINWGSVADTGSGINYELQRRVHTGSWSAWSNRYTGINANFDDSGAFADGNLLEYRVRACNGAGTCSLNWQYSNGLEIDSETPAQVTGVEEGATAGTDDDWATTNAFVIYWNSVADTGSGISYEIDHCLNGVVNSGTGTCSTGWSNIASGISAFYHWNTSPYGHGDLAHFRVRAVNGAGGQGFWSTPSDGITLDTQLPDSSVDVPSIYTPGIWPDNDQIFGGATDTGSGVSTIHIRIYDNDGAVYWSGTDWSGTSSSWILADGANSWTYDFPQASLTVDHIYQIESRATDVAGNVETTYGIGSFLYTDGAPDAPVITSTTHINPGVWYNDNQPSFEWNEPDSPIGVVGYSLLLDQYPASVPDKIEENIPGRTYDAATTPDGTWYFHVRAVDSTGQWGPAGHVQINIDTTTPQASASVTEENPDVDYDADGNLTIYWSAVPDTGSGITYELSRCTNGGLSGSCSSGWASVVSGLSGASYNDAPGGNDGDTLRYRIRATNGVTLTGNWTESDGVTLDTQSPAQPGGIFEDNTAEPDRDYHSAANGAVTVYWNTVTDTGSGITYRLEKELNNSGIWNLVDDGLGNNAYNDSGLYSDGDEIIYRVTAVNGVGLESAPLESDGFIIDLNLPALSDWVREGVNTDPDWDYDDDGAFTVYWAAVADTGSGITYRLEKSVDDGAWQVVATDIAGTSQADTNPAISDGSTIRYRVTPINGTGTEGPYRLSDGIVIDLDPLQDPAWLYENNPDVDFDSDGAVWVNWAAVNNTGSGITYQLEKRIGAGAWTTIAPNLSLTSYNDTATFPDETVLTYRVTAHNGVGRSSSAVTSDGVRVDSDIPGTPTNVGEGDSPPTDDDFDEDNTFDVFWTGVSPTATGDQIYYTIERNVNGSGWEEVPDVSVTATSWDDPQAYSNGDQIAYRVTAVNGAGMSGSASSPSDGITIDTGKPNSTINTSGYYNAISWPDQIAGTASDDYSDLSQVHVTIFDNNDGEWWDGDSWESGGPYWLLASGTDNWSYALADANLTDGHNYDLQSRATDNAGNVETSLGTGSFIFADSGPAAPVISSATHPVEANWYSHNDPQFSWTTPSGPANIVGYSYILDQNPGTTPNTTVSTTGNSQSYLNTTDGTWFFHVRALDSANVWGPAGHYQINIDTATPSAPASVTDDSPDVDFDFDGSITVYWTGVPDTGSGIEYIVERELNTSGSWTVLSNTVQSTSYPDPATGYLDGTTIKYRISARNGVNLSGSTKSSDGFTVDNDAPNTPAWVTENAADPNDEDYDPDGSVRVFWDASNNTGSGLSYTLERRVSVGGIPGSWTTVASGLAVTNYVDPITHNDDDFIEYRVTAVNGVGTTSVVQTSDGIRIDVDAPSAPTEVTENSPDIDWSFDGAVTVFWSGVSPTATGDSITYRLEKQINGGSWTLVSGAGTLPGSTTSFPDSGSYSDGDTIRYRVRATNGANTAGAWRESNGMTIDDSTPAASGWVREENPDIDFDPDGILTVYWSAVTDTGSGINYTLERCLNGGLVGTCSSSWVTVASNLVGTSYFDSDARPDGTTVRYRITAINTVGTAGLPTVSDGLTVDSESPATPSAVGEGDTAGLDDTFDQDNTFFVFWTAPTDTGSGLTFDVEKSLNGGTWVLAASGISGTSWDDPIPYSNGDAIQYRVRAVNGAGLASAWSSASSGITLDFVLPDSAVSSSGFYNAFNWPGFIFGTSSDPGSDVAIVHLSLQRASDSQYWDGTSWQVGQAWLTATNTINWFYTFAPTDGETYDMLSRATDNADNVEANYGVGSFTYSTSGPEAPEISSSTHPTETTWYDDDDPTFNWTVPSSTAPVVGYSYSLDQNPGTTPDAVEETTGLTKSYTDLADGVWYFHVRAKDNAGNWGPADHFAIRIDTATPDDPDDITEESPDIDFDADGTLSVYWDSVNDTGSGITYRLEKKINTAPWTLVISTTNTSYADSGAYLDGDDLTYRVRATNGIGKNSAWTDSDGVTIDSDTPGTPASITEENPDIDFDDDGNFTVHWDSVSDTGSGMVYQLYRRINSGPWILVQENSGISYAESGSYPDNTLLEYQVIAVNGVGTAGNPATSDGVRVDSSTPDTPSAITEGSPDIDYDVDGSYTVYWSAVPDTGSGISYRLERNLNNAGWNTIATQAGLTYADNIGNVDGTTAQYRVTAINGVGTESGVRTSNGVTVDSETPGTPNNVTEESPDIDYYPNADGAVTVYWDAVSDTGSGMSYHLERRVNGGGWATVANNILSTSYPDSGAYADDDLVAYRVTAINGLGIAGTPGASDGVRIDLDDPAIPANIGEGDVAGVDDIFDEDNVFWVYWDAVSVTASGDTILYNVERSRNGGVWEMGGSALLCATTPCQWDDPVPFSNGDTIQYRVKAYNSAGREGNVSATSSGITLDFTPPDSAVTTNGFYNAFNWPGFIYGTASDSLSDVAVVDITIQRQSDSMYWSGAGWQAGEIWLSTTGSLNWQYSFTPTDGETYTVRSRGTDNAGNVETTFGISDFTYTASGPSAPVVSSSTHPSPVSWYNNDDPTLNWTTPSSGVGIQGYSYSLDQTPTTLPDTSIESNNNTVSYNNQTDGTWYFHIRAQDNANNWGPAAHFQINIDTTAPTAPADLTEEQPDIDWDADGDVTVYWSAVADTGSGISYRLERNLNSGGWTLLANGLSDTDYADTGYNNGDSVLYRVRTEDSVGLNSGWITSDGVTFDLSVPETPANVGEGDTVGSDDDWDQDNAFFIFWDAVTATPSGISYSVDRSRNSGVWEEMVTGLTTTSWEDPTPYSSGENVAYRITAHTDAGLSGSASSASDGITLDFIKPDSSIDTSGFYNTFTWPGYIDGTGTDSLSDVALVHLTISRQSDSLYWDGATWLASPTWLTATGSTNWQYTFVPTSGETYDLQSRATDNAGNVETSLGTSSFNYSAEGPEAPVISSTTHPDSNSWYNHNDPDFSWNTPTSGSGIQGYSYQLDQFPDTEPDLSADTASNSRNYTNKADGIWYFHVRALDNASNWGPAGHYQIKIDTTAPPVPDSITEESPDVDWDADGNITVYWSAVSDPSEVSYTLERSTNGGGAWSLVADNITTTLQLDPVTHPDGAILLYRVLAKDAVDLESLWAESDGVTIDSEIPAQVENVGEGDVVGTDQTWDENNAFFVFWDSVDDTASGISYNIERRVNGGAWSIVQTDHSDTFWEDPQSFADADLIEYRVAAINGVGTTGLSSTTSSGITLDFTDPDSQIDTAGPYGPANWPGQIEGTVSDATSGVNVVQINLQRVSDNLYWNGGVWVASPVWLAATGTSTWTYTFAPAEEEAYNLQSRATDNAGNQEISYGVSAFNYTNLEPESIIDTAGLYIGSAWPGQIEGTAFAPAAPVSQVDITLQRASDGLYFDGSGWLSASTWLSATGQSSWHYTFAPADGETYTATARATDAVNNIEFNFDANSFSYDAAPPEISAIDVSASTSYFHNPGLTAQGGTVYFNSVDGEGANQILSVTVTFTEPHPLKLSPPTAFGDSPPEDTAGPWLATYSVEAFIGSQTDALFSVFDTLGLTDTATLDFMQDNQAPASEASIIDDSTNSAVVEVNWQAEDTLSGVAMTHLWVKFQPVGAWTDTGLAQSGLSGSFTYTPTLGTGTYYFATVSVDEVGNVESAPSGFGDDAIDVDNTAPSSDMLAPTYAISSPINITWTASQDAKYTYLYYRYGPTGTLTLSDLPFSENTAGTFEFIPEEGDGHYYFATSTIDDAGNVEAIETDGKALTIFDTTPPTSQASSPANWNTISFIVDWSGDDTAFGSGIKFFDIQTKTEVDGLWTDWITKTVQTSAEFTATFVGDSQATYYFRSRATDLADHVEEWPSDSNGDTSTRLTFPGNLPGRYKVYLPLTMKDYGPQSSLPDLVVDSLEVVPSEFTSGDSWDVVAVVRNAGNTALPRGIWVDLYIDPRADRLPIEANKPFYEMGTYGGIWWISQLQPGETITLTKETILPDWIQFFPETLEPGEHSVYIQVDSLDERTATPPSWARVYESNEHNNILGPVDVTVNEADDSKIKSEPAPVPLSVPLRQAPE